MTVKFAINGFGRIGRNVLRAALSQSNKVELVGVNDLTDAKTLAHLLKYDSVHGRFPGEVGTNGNNLVVNGKEIAVFSEKDPSKIPWASVNATAVLECTGRFTSREAASAHLTAGAKKVVISAPANDADLTIVIGVNHQNYDNSKHHIVSNGSCTTNCLAPIAKVILDNFGIVKGFMTTIHSYTNDQQILDLMHKDPRRARAACLSMIPTSTGAAKAISLVIPELKGKLDGLAVRVPTPNVSLVDLVCEVEKPTTAENINKLLEEAANGPLKGILGVSREPLVSIDYNGCSNSSTVDALSTMVNGNMVKILSWYDNEMGFSHRMVDTLNLIGK